MDPNEFGAIMTPLIGGQTEYLGGCFFNGTPPLERMLELAPDLIVTEERVARSDNSYAVLSEIASTVAVSFDGSQRLRYFTDVARVFGKEEEAQALIKAHHDKLDDVQARLTEPVSMAVVLIQPEGFSLLGEHFAVNPSFARMGLAFDPVVEEVDVYTLERDRAENLSIERVDLMENTDMLVVTQFAQNIGDGDPLDELLQSPLWQTLPIVQQEHVIFINQLDLYASSGLLSFDATTDELAAFLEERGFLSSP